MIKKNILEKIKKSQLGGRGGAAFPVWLKWQTLKEQLKKTNQVYLIINAAEGEPNLIKDAYVLTNHFCQILRGIKLSFDYLGEKNVDKIYCFIRQDYYKKNKEKFAKILKEPEFKIIAKKFIFFIKPDSHDYMAGEESVLLNIIEQESAKPRLRPPFPAEFGLFNCPSLIHNVETWYALGQIASDDYKQERYYYISGQVKKAVLVKLAENLTAKQILKKTNNWPKFRFFAQLGGDACGGVFLDKQLDRAVEGSGSITIYPLKAKVAETFLQQCLDFHCQQSCGQCIPCREGSYRLLEMMNNQKFKAKDLTDIVFALKFSSFCAFGRSLADVLSDYFTHINPALSEKSRINIEIKKK